MYKAGDWVKLVDVSNWPKCYRKQPVNSIHYIKGVDENAIIIEKSSCYLSDCRFESVPELIED